MLCIYLYIGYAKHSAHASISTSSNIVLPDHIPYLLEKLKPIWGKWKLLGVALSIPLAVQLQDIESPIYMLKTIEMFGELTPFEVRTWAIVHKAVVKLDKLGVANNIKKEHKNLKERCKFFVLNCRLDSQY